MNLAFGRALAAAVLLAAAGGLVLAADQPAADTKALDKAIVASLRDAHDRGADLYNMAKDYAGAYRLYEGALVTVRPLLAHRPEVQKAITAGLANAARDPDPARKAFLLHETIEKVRADLKGTGVAPKPAVEPKKLPEAKKSKETTTPKKETTPKPKPKDNTAAKDGATVSGKVTVKGQPLAAGEVMFVSLDQKAPKVVTAKVKDGDYAAKGLPPGKYAVAVSGEKAKVPAKFAMIDTSALRAEVKAGANTLDFDLK